MEKYLLRLEAVIEARATGEEGRERIARAPTVPFPSARMAATSDD